MTGFGASFTDSSAWLVANSPLRNSIMTKLFSPSQGIGLDFLRQPIGASDFSRSVYSYDDRPSGQTDPSLANFSISHDTAYILPILQQALQLNPAITIMATPWSPPGWMKTSGSMIGGTLNTADYQVFANYLVKFLQAYQAAGVPVSLITPQNEPEYSPSNYPGSTLTAGQEVTLIDDLGPAIRNAGLGTQILGYDHNWNDTSFPETILGDPTAGSYTAGTAWHCYAGDPSAQTTVHNAYPGKATYFTECSGTQSSNPADTFADSLDWQTENLIIGATRNWAKSVVTWNMALDPSGGPSMNCTTCTGVVTVDNSAGTATYNAENQEWQFQPTSNGYYQVDTRNAPGVVWDVTGGPSATGNGTPIQLWSATAGTNQQWLPTQQSDGSYTFTARTSGSECLDVTNRSTSNGTQLQQWSCTSGDTAQTFRLVPVS
jgi:glucosylceramidase